MNITHRCASCDYTESFPDAATADAAGWDVPPYFTQGADRARARTEAGVIEIVVRCKNGDEEVYTFRYEGSGG